MMKNYLNFPNKVLNIYIKRTDLNSKILLPLNMVKLGSYDEQ